MAPEGGEIDELLSSRINSGYPRDLLRRFTGNSAGGDGTSQVGGGDMGEIELGLSLGGCYAAETKGKGLVRASSMTLSMFPGERIDFPAVTAPLTRASSLPTETEEERRKRKEMECLKRMEAKRKRSEKRAAAAANNNNRKEENLLDEDLVCKVANGVVVPAEVAKWAAGIGGRGGKRPASQGSIGSQGSSSSGVSDFEDRPVQGVDISGVGICAEVRSPSTIPSAADRTNHRAAAATSKQVVGKPAKLSIEGDEPSRKRSCTSSKLNRVKETERNVLEEMPSVSTTGNGPNGRRIDGFLYKYSKGEEVRIVCVCHGRFLTPAEFVKHAGGGDVAHPLRHIVVNPTGPTPSAFL